MPVIQLPSQSAINALGMSGGRGILGYNLSDQQYRNAFNQYSGQLGYRLADLWGYVLGGAPSYAAIWEECIEHPEQFSDHAIAAADYQATFDNRQTQGFRLVRTCGYAVGQATMYAAIWEKSAGPGWFTRHNFNMLAISNHQREVRQMGYRIADLKGYLSFGPNPDFPSAPPTWVPLFSSIWVESDGRDWMISLPVSLSSFQHLFDQLRADGWWPVQLSAYGSEPRIIGRWEKPQGLTAIARHGIDSAAYSAELTAQDTAGLRPTSVGAFNQLSSSGVAAPPLFCALWQRRDADQVIPRLVKAFLRDYEIPGLSLAVARQDRLAYASGFGVADKTTGEAVQASSRFRIASITKAITATTIFGLVARNALSLDDRVFGPTSHLSALTGTPADRRVTDITVRHLLQHGGGGWSNDANDPMFTNPELSARDLITKVLATRSLDNDPGTNFAYSNFGYCVLGRVIEAVTGETYENWVRENVLAACGSSMTIAGNTLVNRQPGEVVYYGLDDQDPYGMQVSRMDSHGGWVTTATDYLRFLVRVDGLPPDLLRPNGITLMTTPSGLPGSNGYACGWHTTTAGTWWHDGVLPGTRSIMVRTADGFCWAALANSGRTVEGDTTRDTVAGLDALMWAIRDKVDFWPFSDQL